MRKWLWSFILVSLIYTGCRTGKNVNERISASRSEDEYSAPINYMEQTTWLLGYIDPLLFTRFPHAEWYKKGYDAYQPEQEVITKLEMINKDPISIEIVMGTWCPDSRREVPRFMKILDLWNFNSENVTLIGVDNAKVAPIGGYEELEIERVPTFIILENKVEIGRIIENPVASLEQDMLGILERNEK
jgi:thiol-disulfide isomerase/thioredoxin